MAPKLGRFWAFPNGSKTGMAGWLAASTMEIDERWLGENKHRIGQEVVLVLEKNGLCQESSSSYLQE